MKKNLLIVLLVCAAVVGFAVNSFAYPEVYLKETGVNPSSSGYIHFPALGNQNVLYGEYDLAIDIDKAGPKPYVPISGFCVEDAFSTSANNVVYALIPVADMGQNYVNAAWVFSQYEQHLVSAQAAQLAIWEVVLDPGNLDPRNGMGNMYATFSNTFVTDAYNLLQGMDTTNFNAYGYMIAHSPVDSLNPTDPQDYIVHPVPEPATMLLLGSGLVGLAGWGRKKLFRKG